MKEQIKKYHQEAESLLKKAKLAKQKERTSKTPNFAVFEELPSAKKKGRKRKRRSEA